MKKILFSLPCAGGRAANYDIWKSHINFELINIEYPGHWGRWGETACTNINDLVEDVTRQISDRVEDTQGMGIFLIGHSMGALIAWLVAQSLKAKKNILLEGIIIAAMLSPDQLDSLNSIPLTAEADIKEFLHRIRQVPDNILNSAFFNSYFFPAIESDFRIFRECVEKTGEFRKMDVSCLVLYGTQDPIINMNHLTSWNNYAESVIYSKIDGDHFFIYDSAQIKKICCSVNNFINNYHIK